MAGKTDSCVVDHRSSRSDRSRWEVTAPRRILGGFRCRRVSGKGRELDHSCQLPAFARPPGLRCIAVQPRVATARWSEFSGGTGWNEAEAPCESGSGRAGRPQPGARAGSPGAPASWPWPPGATARHEHGAQGSGTRRCSAQHRSTDQVLNRRRISVIMRRTTQVASTTPRPTRSCASPNGPARASDTNPLFVLVPAGDCGGSFSGRRRERVSALALVLVVAAPAA
jgi:hypothetical protein